ncbi:hypothetical protein RSSM_00951 [Rhodopirellula sallentina SM41]|uniref:Uncharacterized protein n=1 Tax=Rhodopirellula sallentina SM41 TaxID=1263870 RepID=M5U833_9BACT|nr:hypothetical protein RSSM_00951 [Rhodopirellula sallentina SM41]
MFEARCDWEVTFVVTCVVRPIVAPEGYDENVARGQSQVILTCEP